ncbi:MAG: nucleoside deaminase [Clostridiaceae bacterium]
MLKDEFMYIALEEAKKAYNIDEVPVGAIIVRNGEIISRGYNLKEINKDITAHAEIIAIKNAEKVLDNWRLNDCEMYVTLESCPMCASAIAQARIKRLYIGTSDINGGACGSVINLIQNSSLGYMVDVVWMYKEECSDILIDFFQKKRM